MKTPKLISGQAEAAELLGLQAIGYIAENDDYFERFLAITGAEFTSLKEAVADLAFLGGVLDYMLQDEALLIAFASSAGVRPEAVVNARRHLPGASDVA